MVRTMYADGSGIGVDHPDEFHACGTIIGQLLIQFVDFVSRGNDFDGDIRCDLDVSFIADIAKPIWPRMND
jgi:hypothetical protein